MNTNTPQVLKRKKGFTLVEIMIVVVIIGLLAAVAVPAFSKVRAVARSKAITNNLRQIASAGQQYLLDNSNGSSGSVSYAQLVTSGYLKPITPVTDENYTNITVQDANTTQTISVTSAIMRTTISYSF